MKSLLIASAILCLPFGTALCQVSLEKNLPPSGSAGAVGNFSAKVAFPGGYLDYHGEVNATEPMSNPRFGLSFQRPPATNGGWDLWRFLRVWVRLEGHNKVIEVTENCLLEDVQILEDEARRIFEFRWPLDEENRLIVTFLQYPDQADWLMMRLEMEGEGAFLDKVMLSAYPGNTAGPKERERWIAVGEKQFPLLPQPKELPSVSNGLVFFNRMAQQNSGCLLVVDPHGIRDAFSAGGYNASVRYDMAPGTTTFHAALGGFQEKQSEEVIRVFAMEGARNALHTLQNVDWKPQLDIRSHVRLFSNLEQLLADVGTVDEKDNFKALHAEYQHAKMSNDPRGMSESVNKARLFIKTLVSRALSQWK